MIIFELKLKSPLTFINVTMLSYYYSYYTNHRTKLYFKNVQKYNFYK